MNIGKIKIVTIFALIIGAIILFIGFREFIPKGMTRSVSYEILNRWEMPSELREISGISWLDDTKIAAVQDEEGIIFIYDLKEKRISKKIDFGENGDYEGIALNGKDAYVMESNGRITEIIDFQSPDRTIHFYSTPFSSKNNMESLELDTANNRLLMVPKDEDLDSDRFKGVYSFSLDTKKMASEPVFQIDMGDKILKRLRNNDLAKTFKPSDLALHPGTGEIYVLEGSKPKLLVMDSAGKALDMYTFGKKLFPQPEGITFSASGTLYIASEGKKDGNGSITELRLHR